MGSTDTRSRLRPFSPPIRAPSELKAGRTRWGAAAVAAPAGSFAQAASGPVENGTVPLAGTVLESKRDEARRRPRHCGADAPLAALPGHALPILSISDLAAPVAMAASTPEVCHEPSAALTKVRFARDGA